MMRVRPTRLILPGLVFASVFLFHFIWLGVFPERNPVQDRFAALPGAEPSWFARYMETRSFFLGYSYAISVSFAAIAFRRYRESRFCTARSMAIGGVTYSGVLSVVGCYLLGCCGSPMLAVYLNLFGAAFLPLAKPILAGLTTFSIIAAWWWMNRRMLWGCCRSASSPSVCQCDGEAIPIRVIQS